MHNPLVPETLEGWSLLHQAFHLDWRALAALDPAARRALADEAAPLFARPSDAEAGDCGQSILVQLLGHKGDLLVVHSRRTFDDLSQAQLDVARLGLASVLRPAWSYVSIVELGMYDMTAKIHEQLGAAGLTPGSEPFEQAFDEEMAVQARRMAPRLFPVMPRRRHVCFYPMNKRRGEAKNWYSEAFDSRAAMMREHGHIGRHYAGRVTQIISGSIGFDDWEWGVDLFADDPLTFKKLIYEMRFDEASAVYAEFGAFYVGLQIGAQGLSRYLEGETPAFQAGERKA
jgi:hydrogen peroxide-dependent heme synthase